MSVLMNNASTPRIVKMIKITYKGVPNSITAKQIMRESGMSAKRSQHKGPQDTDGTNRIIPDFDK